jgi:phage/conjugal plasmid C-4 type zinc finger TraR family protein
MTDIYDRATEREEEARADALAAQSRRAGLAGKTIHDSARNCRVCDETIPDARRRALPGVQTCVLCQAELEQAGNSFAPHVWSN